jgi:integrase
LTLQQFEAELSAGRSPNDRRNRRCQITRFGKFIGREPLISDLTTEALIRFHAWLVDRGYSTRCAMATICRARALWRSAYAQGLCSAEPPAAHTSQRPDQRKARGKTDGGARAIFKIPDTPPPTLTSESPLLEVFWHFAITRLEGRQTRAVEHYRQAVDRFSRALGKSPSLVDLTDANIEFFMERAGITGYSHFTIESTRWSLRALWHHAHQEGVKDDLPSGPLRPVNQPPAPIVEDISSALEVHRASVERERKRDVRIAESPRKVLASVGKRLKRLLSPPPRKPQAAVAAPGPDRDRATLTIAELLAAWREFAKGYYPPNGKTTSELTMVDCAVRALEAFYGHELAAGFGPKKLKATRELMVNGYTANGKQFRGTSRRHINQQVGRIKRVFKWATSEELVSPTVYQALATVSAIKFGRTEAYELEPIGPVDSATVEATLAYLSPVVGAMVRLQLLTGMRPGEVCIVRPRDVDRSGDVWQYRPGRHKTEHHGRKRLIYIGPQAQEVLAPYLEREPEAYCFSPRESLLWWHAKRRTRRKTRVQPSQVDRSRPGGRGSVGVVYSHMSYQKSISGACRKGGIPHWHPNQLRHTAATKVRAEFGLEAAQAILGHSRADVTQVYAERDSAGAIAAMGAIG